MNRNGPLLAVNEVSQNADLLEVWSGAALSLRGLPTDPLVFTKCKNSIQNGHRLENLSWRLWFASKHSQKPMNLLQSISPVPSLCSSVGSVDSCLAPANAASSLPCNNYANSDVNSEAEETVPELTSQSAPHMVPTSAPPVNPSRKATESKIPSHILPNAHSRLNSHCFDHDEGSESDDLSTSSMTDSEDLQEEEWAISPESYSEYVMRQERLRSFFEKKQLDRMNKTPHRIPTKKPSTLTLKLRQDTNGNGFKRKSSPPGSSAPRNITLMSESLRRNVMWEREFARSRLYTVRTQSNSSNASNHDKQSSFIFDIDDHW
jgi:hypothetical protein